MIIVFKYMNGCQMKRNQAYSVQSPELELRPVGGSCTETDLGLLLALEPRSLSSRIILLGLVCKIIGFSNHCKPDCNHTPHGSSIGTELGQQAQSTNTLRWMEDLGNGLPSFLPSLSPLTHLPPPFFFCLFLTLYWWRHLGSLKMMFSQVGFLLTIRLS